MINDCAFAGSNPNLFVCTVGTLSLFECWFSVHLDSDEGVRESDDTNFVTDSAIAIFEVDVRYASSIVTVSTQSGLQIRVMLCTGSI